VGFILYSTSRNLFIYGETAILILFSPICHTWKQKQMLLLIGNLESCSILEHSNLLVLLSQDMFLLHNSSLLGLRAPPWFMAFNIWSVQTGVLVIPFHQ
jgi:hypothetical protein